jgi:hypothetical protein
MARLYKIDGGEPITGTKLVEEALTIFNSGQHSMFGNCAYPRTIQKAQWYLGKLGSKVYTKKDAETEWSLMG